MSNKRSAAATGIPAFSMISFLSWYTGGLKSDTSNYEIPWSIFKYESNKKKKNLLGSTDIADIIGP